jgi:GTP cyclohydrolase I
MRHVDRSNNRANGSTGRRPVGAEERERFHGYLAEIFEALGMDLDTPGTHDTPHRFLSALVDATAGYDGDPKLVTVFPAEHGAGAHRGMIIEGPIAFHALCEHHALPFYGAASVGYVASERLLGISKLTRLVRLFARRFTVQERLGEQIADGLSEMVEPDGIAVRLEAVHLCTHMRGVMEPSTTVTTHWRGLFTDPALRQEFLAQARTAPS